MNTLIETHKTGFAPLPVGVCELTTLQAAAIAGGRRSPARTNRIARALVRLAEHISPKPHPHDRPINPGEAPAPGHIVTMVEGESTCNLVQRNISVADEIRARL